MSESSRIVHAYVLPEQVPPRAMAGGVAVVIDQFRASTTICAALAAGAAAVHPCRTPEEARAMKEAKPEVLLGGERRGVLIKGFDLANSPEEYTPERVGGRTVAFTTTNGTKAVLHAREDGAARILIGCLGNISALVDAVQEEARPIHLVCAGTDGVVTLEDCVAAGAIASALSLDGWFYSEDDTGLALALLYDGLVGEESDLSLVLRDGFGGRNLRRVGLEWDIEYCSVRDRYHVAPELDLKRGAFVRQTSRR